MPRIRMDYDVIILGSGMGGSILAAVLARHGARVMVIDSENHPRFAIGESTIPHTSQLLTLIGEEHDVPEFCELGLGSPEGIRRNVGPTCGIKRTFGFASHRFGEEHDPQEAIQFGNVWRDENHLFRQDFDAHLVRVALKYGARMMHATRVEAIEIEEAGVLLKTNNGNLTGDYIADGSGFRSVLAQMYGLREEPCRFNHHSRSIFTHMIDVTPFEECAGNFCSVKWSQGTLHHVFERGWIWVIPFNNWEGSTNPIVSVGLTIDPRTYPQADAISPAEEFYAFIEKLPSVARQFEKAKEVRSWVRTGRLQYSSSRCVGYRYCLLSHASGFIDPLFSRGLVNTIEVNEALARVLLGAIAENDYSFERFAGIEDLQRSILDYADRLADGSFIAWSDFDVWNAWLRVWAVGTGCVESNLGGHLMMSRWHQGRKLVADPLFSPFEDSGYKTFFNHVYSIMRSYESYEYSAETTSSKLFAALQQYHFLMRQRNDLESHYWAIKNPNCRDLYLGNEELSQRWARQEADPRVAKLPPGSSIGIC